MRRTGWSRWQRIGAVRDVRRRIVITLALLALYRFVAHVPAPGINREAAQRALELSEEAGGVVLALDVISGGAVSTFSVLAVGAYAYVTAQVFASLLVPLIPAMRQRLEDDPRAGRELLQRVTSSLSVVLSAPLSLGLLRLYSGEFARCLGALTRPPPMQTGIKNLVGTVTAVAAMMAGAKFVEWLADLISEFGLRGQGIALIIVSGILARLPGGVAQLAADERGRWANLGAFVVITGLTVLAIVYVQQGRRNVRLMYSGKRMGLRQSMPPTGNLPLMVNMAGVVPLIFAYSMLVFPAVAGLPFLCMGSGSVQAAAIGVIAFFAPANPYYWLMYSVLTVVFTFIYSDVVFQQQDYGENLRRAGRYIPGVLPGKPTQAYLTRVLHRVTLPGALFLGGMAALPFLVNSWLGAEVFLFSSVGLLFTVGTIRDALFAIEVELMASAYDGGLLF